MADYRAAILPIAVTASEWMEQNATIDGVFAVAGAYTHLSPTLFITGASGCKIINKRCGRLDWWENCTR